MMDIYIYIYMCVYIYVYAYMYTYGSDVCIYIYILVPLGPGSPNGPLWALMGQTLMGRALMAPLGQMGGDLMGWALML